MKETRMRAMVTDQMRERIREFANQEGLKMPRARYEIMKAGLDSIDVSDN
ncbi:MAG: hypothetical protein ABEI52_07705 [Halobacteriaceae archaeon]